MNPVWLASKLFLAPILGHLIIGHRASASSLFGDNFWTSVFASYILWQLVLAAVYLPIFYWRVKGSDFLVSVMIRAWPLGLALIPMNPVSLIITPLFVWTLLRNRIEREEPELVEFFGREYLDYRRRVPSGLPFVK